MIELVKSAFSAGLNWLYIILGIFGALLLLGVATYITIKTCKGKTISVVTKIITVVLVVAVLAVSYYFDLLLIISSIRAI